MLPLITLLDLRQCGSLIVLLEQFLQCRFIARLSKKYPENVQETPQKTVPSLSSVKTTLVMARDRHNFTGAGRLEPKHARLWY